MWGKRILAMRMDITLKILLLLLLLVVLSPGGIRASRLLERSLSEPQIERKCVDLEELTHVLADSEAGNGRGGTKNVTVMSTQGVNTNRSTPPFRLQKLAERLLLMQMGSKPPSCDGKCALCRPCVAVEVPISNHVVQRDNAENSTSQIQQGATVAPEDTNYMPESWRCSCGDIYYNP